MLPTSRDEFLRRDERAHRRERVVVLRDQPVGAEARVAAAAAVRHVVLERVAEDVVHAPALALTRAAGRPMTTPSSHSHSICVRPTGRRTASPSATIAPGSLMNMNGFQRVSPAARSQMPGALDRAGGRCAGRRRGLRRVALAHARHLDVVLAVVHGDVQHRRRIHDRRQDLQRADVVDVGRPRVADGAHDLEDARAQPVVARDQILHVGRRRNARRGIRDGGVRRGEIDDDAIRAARCRRTRGLAARTCRA